MLKFKVVYSTKISLTFSAIKKKNRPKKILRPSGGQLYIKQVRKISNWSVKPLSSYSDHRFRKHGFERNAFKVLSTICMQIQTAPFKVIYLHKLGPNYMLLLLIVIEQNIILTKSYVNRKTLVLRISVPNFKSIRYCISRYRVHRFEKHIF